MADFSSLHVEEKKVNLCKEAHDGSALIAYLCFAKPEDVPSNTPSSCGHSV